jgi:hypothetical protein
MALTKQIAPAPVDNDVHSFLVPWRRAHRKRQQTWKEKRSPNWQEVTCALCLQHKPPANSNQTAPAPASSKR